MATRIADRKEPDLPLEGEKLRGGGIVHTASGEKSRGLIKAKDDSSCPDDP
jgi:hypothetical protein